MSTRRGLHLSVTAACLAAAAVAAPGGQTRPSGPTGTVARVDAIFAGFDRPDSPGCAVGIIRAGKLQYAKGYGLADLEHDIRITPRTVFYLASVSKQFTAVAIALLAHEGKLSLDDEIRKYVPEVPAFDQAVTLRHLVHHTSGLRDYFGVLSLAGWPGDGPISERDFLDLVGRQRALNFTPGGEYLYSNTGYVLLAVAVERASGQSIREYAAEKIFRPLGMSSTQFRDDHGMLIKGRALAYQRGEGGLFRLSVPGFDLVGDGGVYSTVDDLAKWDANFYDGRVGGPQVLDLVHTQGRLASGEAISYAFGMNLGRYRGHPTVEHGGAYAGYRADFLRIPAKRLSVATLCNTGTADANRLSRRVADVFLDPGEAPARTTSAESAHEPPARGAAEPSRPPDAQYAGVYWNERTDVIRVIESDGRRLMLAGAPNGVELVATGDRTFRPSGSASATVSFRPRQNGGIEMAWSAQGEPPLVFVSRPPVTPPVESLGAYAGTYYSPDADTRWTIALRDGRLVLDRPRMAGEPLRPAFEDAFSARQISALIFTRDGARRITGFTVSTARVRRLRFERQ